MNTVRQPLYFNELHNVPTKMRGLRREMERRFWALWE